ncbi:TonB-dependent receptor [Chitinophaga sp. SYP-B3965]|uniref:TonB-dependent receptor plug domain-containing protein n=1 Tax=Chitinophaga sp. SYP-B3965 TaxID=2663120 RepID=UPI001299D9DD|nr:TonB-dependent receptor [Chitinophaga sp. SYP-B3965]MRG44548.1 TonB-dependent receptor [Chitinophaga sp. SYP-B3965]
MRKIFWLTICIMRTGALFAQTDSVSSSKDLQEVVVTATRNEQLVNKVPIPVTIINKQQLQRMGAVLLQQVLAEQTGLFITSNHGTGVQMQGLESQYTLILLDGEPLVGRTAGTLDLSRIMVSNIERIEIIKGPVSSLYGSDALAGVINIITRGQQKEAYSSIGGRYGSNNTYNIDGETRMPYQKGMFTANAGYMHSGGYTLGSGNNTPTIAPFKAITLQSSWQQQWTDKWQTVLNGRYYQQRYDSYFQDASGTVDDIGKEKDANLSINLKNTPNKRFTQVFRMYYSYYNTKEDMVYRQNKNVYDASFFTQQYLKPEYQLDWQLHEKHQLTAGAGYVHESVEATRYDDKMAFNTGYVFLQENWKPADKWNILLGGRFDLHNQYPSQFSPKISLSYQFLPQWRVLGSAGRGYRAPDFRQLYLHFNNAAVGYTVAGTKLAKQIIQDMQAKGQISQLNVNLDDLKDLDAESSWSYNLGVQGKRIRVNGFYNKVKNLIDTRAIAEKTNGQRVFSYVNVKSITTYGAEAEYNQPIGKYWQASAGYQYLRTVDNELYDQVKDGQVYTVDKQTNETRALKRNEYFGLFSRSHHTANLKLAWIHARLGLDANARVIYRSKYGFADENGNQTPDLNSEFVKGYAVVNLAAAKALWENRIRIQATVENLFEHTDAAHIPTLPGRLYTLGINFKFPH